LSIGLEMTDLFPPPDKHYRPVSVSQRNEKPIDLAWHELILTTCELMRLKGERLNEKQKAAETLAYKITRGK